MKTAVSIPNRVFAAGEALATRLKLSRSALYAQALEAFIRARRTQQITARLNAVYGTEAAKEQSRADRALLAATAGRRSGDTEPVGW